MSVKHAIAAVSVLAFLGIQIFWHFSGTWIQHGAGSVRVMPHEHLVFLKTHKTGGSTIAQILLRHGERYNYNFAMYPRNALIPGKIDPKKLLPAPRGEHYQMIAQHFGYDRETINSIFPGDKFVFTVLRDPVEVFLSAYHFLNIGGKIEEKNSYDERIGSFVYVLEGLSPAELKTKYGMFVNCMSSDLGFDDVYDKDIEDGLVDEFISRLDDDLDLAIIHEFFDLGLLLLKSDMNWELKDILYVNENVKSSISATSFHKLRLSDETINQIRKLNHIDVKLYEHFTDRFISRIFQDNHAVDIPLGVFRRELRDVIRRCICGNDTSGLFGTVQYKICPGAERECRELLTDSWAYGTLVYNRQLKRLNETMWPWRD